MKVRAATMIATMAHQKKKYKIEIHLNYIYGFEQSLLLSKLPTLCSFLFQPKRILCFPEINKNSLLQNWLERT
jgi:hypothetical protein